MSKVLSTKLSFSPSESQDAVGYKLYVEQAPDPVTYDSPSFDLGNKTEVFISTLPGLDQVDGVYNLGVTSVDDAGLSCFLSASASLREERFLCLTGS